MNNNREPFFVKPEYKAELLARYIIEPNNEDKLWLFFDD
jgi:hypothetical protein